MCSHHTKLSLIWQGYEAEDDTPQVNVMSLKMSIYLPRYLGTGKTLLNIVVLF